jgi:hypothetical protein
MIFIMFASIEITACAGVVRKQGLKPLWRQKGASDAKNN